MRVAAQSAGGADGPALSFGVSGPGADALVVPSHPRNRDGQGPAVSSAAVL